MAHIRLMHPTPSLNGIRKSTSDHSAKRRKADMIDKNRQAGGPGGGQDPNEGGNPQQGQGQRQRKNQQGEGRPRQGQRDQQEQKDKEREQQDKGQPRQPAVTE